MFCGCCKLGVKSSAVDCRENSSSKWNCFMCSNINNSVYFLIFLLRLWCIAGYLKLKQHTIDQICICTNKSCTLRALEHVLEHEIHSNVFLVWCLVTVHRCLMCVCMWRVLLTATVAVVKSRDMHWALLAQKDHKDVNLASLRMLLIADGANPCMSHQLLSQLID